MYRLGRAFHLRLLSALCNDLIEGVALKAEIQTRVDNMLALHATHRQSVVEVGSSDNYHAPAVQGLWVLVATLDLEPCPGTPLLA